MKWLLNIAYALLLALLSPVILWRVIRHGRYRKGWAEKLLGRLPISPDGPPVIWFHAVSVGEVVQLHKIVERFQLQHPDEFQIVVTSSTDTGFELAESRLNEFTVTWFPLDFSWAVSNAIRRVRPDIVVLFELELWPNFLRTCRQQKVKTAVINARMSDRSFRGYSRGNFLLRSVLEGFDAVGAQTDEYAERFQRLGCGTDAVTVTGSVKFDGVLTDRANEKTVRLRQLFRLQPDELVFVAGSTQDPEEQLALEAWQELRREHPQLRLILVPRHRERFDAVADIVTDAAISLARRSQLTEDSSVPPESVILLDTIGELGACWGLADFAFVGGSFGSRGGQNMLEPSAFGAAVMFGPKTSNFRDIVMQLKAADAAVELAAPEDLVATLSTLLHGETERKRLGCAAKEVVSSQQGAIERTIQLILSIAHRGQ